MLIVLLVFWKINNNNKSRLIDNKIIDDSQKCFFFKWLIVIWMPKETWKLQINKNKKWCLVIKRTS